ncbi:MAG: hypothetical protein ACI8WT_004765 [Clostridium sp.]|jgi:hypothetical protein
MYNSVSSTKSKFSLGGITMRFAFFKKRDLHSRYRRKPKHLINTCPNYDFQYLVILNTFK